MELPYSIVRNFPTINTDVVSFSNFRFEQTGAWSGNILINYEISEEILLEQDEYFFIVTGSATIACGFYSKGEIIKEYAGTYVFSVTLPRDLTVAGCTDGYTSYLFNNIWLRVVDDYNSDTLINLSLVLEAMFED